MSDDLRGLFKRELDQIPLRPAQTWVPADRRRTLRPRLGWRTPLAIGAAIVVLVAAIVGGRQLATFRDRTAAAPGVVAGKAIYLSPSFNGSGWIQIDPITLKDVTGKPLMDIGWSSTNSSTTLVSRDGSTVIVSNYSSGHAEHSVYDGRTGRLRGSFVPEVAMALGGLSADGEFALGRVGDEQGTMTGEKVIVRLADGRVIRRVPAVGPLVGRLQAWPMAPDLSAIYYVVTPSPLIRDSIVPLSQPYSLVVQSTVTGDVSTLIPMPGIVARTVSTGPAAGPTMLSLFPAIATSPDGSHLAALSADGSTLDIVDTRTLAVRSVTVHRKTSLFDLFRPLVAEAKTLNDEERQSIVFTPDGSAVISYLTSTHYDDVNGPTRTTRGIQRIEVATGQITAETFATDGIYGLTVSPDGRSVYLIVRAKEPPTPVYLLRRLDAQTLELKAERGLPDYAELKILAAPAAPGATAPPTLPTRTQASSDYAGWGSREAFGVRFSVPSSWKGPDDIDTQKGPDAPRNWLVFTDASGKTQVTVWLWDAASPAEVAKTRLAGPGSSPRKVTITDAGQAREVLEVHALASWSGPTGAGTYDNRHLLVQLTPSLVADVIVSAPRIDGPSKLTTEQIELQDRITVRLAAQ